MRPSLRACLVLRRGGLALALSAWGIVAACSGDRPGPETAKTGASTAPPPASTPPRASATASSATVDPPAGSRDAPTPPVARAACPKDLVPGARCDFEGRCPGADDPRRRCVTTHTCAKGVVSPPESNCAPLVVRPRAACPAPFRGAVGPRCAKEDESCGYDDATCLCAACASDLCLERGKPVSRWICPRTTDPGCPAKPVGEGTPCATAGARCTWGDVMFEGVALECTDGRWTRRRVEIGP